MKYLLLILLIASCSKEPVAITSLSGTYRYIGGEVTDCKNSQSFTATNFISYYVFTDTDYKYTTPQYQSSGKYTIKGDSIFMPKEPEPKRRFTLTNGRLDLSYYMNIPNMPCVNHNVYLKE